MLKDDIKKVMEIDPSTARGRAVDNGRAIILEPDKESKIYHTEQRADIYRNMMNTLANEVRNWRHGLTDDELESVEFIREQLRSLSITTYARTLNR